MGSKKLGQPGARLEFRTRPEQGQAAQAASVASLALGLIENPAERPLGAVIEDHASLFESRSLTSAVYCSGEGGVTSKPAVDREAFREDEVMGGLSHHEGKVLLEGSGADGAFSRAGAVG